MTFNLMGKFIVILAIVFSVGVFGCRPPVKSSGPVGTATDGGVPLVDVSARPKAKVRFKLIEQNGVELWQTQDKLVKPAAKPGGTFYYGMIGQGPKTFNPWASKDSTSSSISGMYGAGLVSDDPYTGDVIPYLAKTVVVAPDNVTYTVTLRKGLKWSDGKPLTAKDVVFTWNRIIKPGLGNASSRDNCLVEGKFPTVTQSGPLTVVFKTAKPFAPFKRRLGYAIAPAHVFEPMLNAKGNAVFDSAWNTQTALKHPEQLVGAGLWRLTKYDTAQQQAIFERNPHFAMVDKENQPLPYLQKYVVRFVNDLNNLQLQFEQGKVDVYGVGGEYVAHVRKLKQPAFTLYNLGPSDMKSFVVFNLARRTDPETHQPVVSPELSAVFNSTAFRQAVHFAVDRDAIVTNILKGVGQPAYTAESPTSPFIHPILAKGVKRDVPKAREILRTAGFTWAPITNRKAGDDAQKDQLISPAGKPVVLELMTNSGNTERENIAVSLKADLAELGITLHLKPIEFNVLVGRLDSGNWQAVLLGLGGGSPLEPHDGANVWRTDGALHMFDQRVLKPGQTVSDARVWETAIDTLFEQGAQTFAEDKRRKIYHRFQEIVNEQQPFIYLYSPLQIVAVSKALQNIDPTPLGGVLHNLEVVWKE